jgi:hypothetical protein
MSNQKERKQTEESYFTDLPDGAGCTEIWEHLSEQRDK